MPRKKWAPSKCMLKKWGGTIRCPPKGQTAVLADGGSKLARDSFEPIFQRVDEGTSALKTESSTHCDDDTGRHDDVLERHHSVLVLAQTLQSFRGLDVVFQHWKK